MVEKTANWRVLFDLNVVLDVLMHREPYFSDAARLWALAETGQIEGFVAAHSFTTLFYLYRRQSEPEQAYQALRRLLRVFKVASLDRKVIEMACDLAWRDFEDAVQATAANGAGCHYLVTRNLRDYGDQQLTVIQPADLLAVWAAKVTGGESNRAE
jgi:predicted nucleic acid-binding protein